MLFQKRKFKRFLQLLLPKNIYQLFILYYTYIYLQGRTYEINRVISENNYSNYLEVGVWEGETLFKIAETNKKIKVYGVDPYSGSSFQGYYKGEVQSRVDNIFYDKLFNDVLKNASNYLNVEILRMSSKKASEHFLDEGLDIVFIDARHDFESVSNDIKFWMPKVRKGGCLCGHNYEIAFYGVIEAVNQLIGYDNIEINSDSTWFYFKN